MRLHSMLLSMRSSILPSVLVGCLLLLSAAGNTWAMCCPFPCLECGLLSLGQRNFIVFDRTAHRVSMIPNLRFVGTSRDFALVVPTPSLPVLSTVSQDFWREAATLTTPLFRPRTDSNGMHCGGYDIQRVNEAPPTGGVTIWDHVEIGGMLATILSSDDPDSLVSWLNAHEYRVRPEDEARFTPLVLRGWFFTAMRPDPNDPGNDMPGGGWDSSVAPIRFTWDGDSFEMPLSFIDINRASNFPVVFYVVDEHRATLPGFTTDYANRISAQEFDAIEDRFPAVAPLLAPGRFLTHLTNTYTDTSPMDGSIFIERTPNDDEYRLLSAREGGDDKWSADLALLGLLASGVLIRSGRRRRA